MAVYPGIRPLAIALLLLACVPRALHATTVQHIDLDLLLSRAALIIEGEVISSEARWNTEQSHITTFITFQVNDTIKGDSGGSSITLGFAGGTVDDTTLEISGMIYPAVGDKGIYFFEDPGQPQLNPLLGWGQGHFRIKSDSRGDERILTESDAPVIGLEEDAATSSSARSGASATPDEPFSQGVATGIRAGKRDDARRMAMDKKDFKDALKARLGAGASKASGVSKQQTPGEKP